MKKKMSIYGLIVLCSLALIGCASNGTGVPDTQFYSFEFPLEPETQKLLNTPISICGYESIGTYLDFISRHTSVKLVADKKTREIMITEAFENTPLRYAIVILALRGNCDLTYENNTFKLKQK